MTQDEATAVYDMVDKIPEASRLLIRQRLMGKDAWTYGFNFAKDCKAADKYTPETIARFKAQFGKPRDDYDRGFLAGLDDD